MLKNNICFILIVLLSFYGFTQEKKEDSKINHDFEVELEAEQRFFYKSGAFNAQDDYFPSFAIRPNYSLDWNKGYESITLEGFYRWDVDKERTHLDLRELYYQKVKNNWELSVGLKKIYWGVTESNHLVDIINQTDAVESFDGEQKLGQPMVQYSLNTNWGTFDLFYLPFHRKRTFSGDKGRFRFASVIDKKDVTYQSNAQEWRQDLAFRYSHSFSIVDLGVSHFYGNGREPVFTFDTMGSVNAFYPVINQTGLDVQITNNAFLWKLETIYRSSEFQDFFAFTGGVEFTFSNIKNSGIDVGLLAEYLYDDRGDWALNALQNDVFFGSRIAFNDIKDSAILIGGLSDLESSSKVFSIEASRRLGSTWKAEIEGRFFTSISNNDLILSNFANDSFLRFTLRKYF